MKFISKKMVKPECFEDLKTPGVIWQIMKRDQLYLPPEKRAFWVSMIPPVDKTLAQIPIAAFHRVTGYIGSTVVEENKMLIFEDKHKKDLSLLPFRIWGYLDAETFYTEIIGDLAR